MEGEDAFNLLENSNYWDDEINIIEEFDVYYEHEYRMSTDELYKNFHNYIDDGLNFGILKLSPFKSWEDVPWVYKNLTFSLLCLRVNLKNDIFIENCCAGLQDYYIFLTQLSNLIYIYNNI